MSYRFRFPTGSSIARSLAEAKSVSDAIAHVDVVLWCYCPQLVVAQECPHWLHTVSTTHFQPGLSTVVVTFFSFFFVTIRSQVGTRTVSQGAPPATQASLIICVSEHDFPGRQTSSHSTTKLVCVTCLTSGTTRQTFSSWLQPHFEQFRVNQPATQGKDTALQQVKLTITSRKFRSRMAVTWKMVSIRMPIGIGRQKCRHCCWS